MSDHVRLMKITPWDGVAIPFTKVDTRKVIDDPINWKLASTSIWFWARYTHIPKLHSLGEKIHIIKVDDDSDNDIYD